MSLDAYKGIILSIKFLTWLPHKHLDTLVEWRNVTNIVLAKYYHNILPKKIISIQCVSFLSAGTNPQQSEHLVHDWFILHQLEMNKGE